MSRPVFRFAPSPNGHLHLGHAFSAMLDHALARRLGGLFLLRLEDIDQTRCRSEYAAAILDDLAWLGLDWDGEVRRQSRHLADHARALDRLRAQGLLRPGWITRGELRARVAAREARGLVWPRDPDGAPFPPDLVEGEAPERLGLGEPTAWRLHMRAALAGLPALSWREVGVGPAGEHGRVAADPSAWGDPVLARKETPTSYHLAVVVDDALQGVTHVVRGLDLFRATEVHRVLQTLLGLPEPVYLHHPLILGHDGRKLAKSEASTSLAELRAQGATPEDVRGLIGWEATRCEIDRLSRELIASA